MWLGDCAHVPNGLFEPEQGVNYDPRSTIEPSSAKLTPSMLWLLSGHRFESFGTVSPDALSSPADRTLATNFRQRP